MGKVRVLFLICDLSGGGAERVFVHLMNRLDRQRFEVCLGLRRQTGVYLHDLHDDVAITEMGGTMKTAVFRIARCVAKIRPRIVLSTIDVFNVVTGFSRFLTPIRGVRYLARETIVPSMRPHRHVINSIAMCRIAYRMFDRLICPSDDVQRGVRTLFQIPDAKLVKIPNPIDIRVLHARANESEGDEYAPGMINLLAVGRLYPQKGFDLLVRALAVSTNMKLRVHVLGSGPEEPRLKRLAEACGVAPRVHFHGFQPNPYKYMAKADAFVLTSRYEGLPNALLESLALGCPAVAFNCPGGVNELVQHGKNGYLVDAGDVGALARVLDRCEYTRLSRRDIARPIADQYDVQRIVSEYEALFCSMAR